VRPQPTQLASDCLVYGQVRRAHWAAVRLRPRPVVAAEVGQRDRAREFCEVYRELKVGLPVVAEGLVQRHRATVLAKLARGVPTGEQKCRSQSVDRFR
jgi:hypothetical protein